MDGNDYRITLRPNRMLRLRDGRNLVVGVDTGTVWLTQDGDVRDIILRAGDSFRVDRDGTVLLQALNDAAVRFVPRGRTASLDLSPL
jgi:uncharacterized protein (AIM24 family)